MSASHQSHSATTSKKPHPLCATGLADLDTTWTVLCNEARTIHRNERHLRPLVDDVVLSRPDPASMLGARLSRRLSREDMDRGALEPILTEAFLAQPAIVHACLRDLIAIHERDPACFSLLEPLLFYKGFLALTTYRVSHHFWTHDRRWLALYLQSLASEVFAVDIHPAARIGCGILLDHATSFVVGETAIIEDNVSILHEVTLGGTGKESGDRHPIIRSGVLLGAGAKILGRVEIGTGAKVGAGSVVLSDVPPHKTVAGVPAVIVGEAIEANPAIEMNQHLECKSAHPTS
jgi:serine O-acetyltransferase